MGQYVAAAPERLVVRMGDDNSSSVAKVGPYLIEGDACHLPSVHRFRLGILYCTPLSRQLQRAEPCTCLLVGYRCSSGRGGCGLHFHEHGSLNRSGRRRGTARLERMNPPGTNAALPRGVVAAAQGCNKHDKKCSRVVSVPGEL